MKNNKINFQTIRISGLFKTPSNEKEMYQAMKEFRRIQRFLKWFPILFFGIMALVFYLIMRLTQLKLPIFLLVIVSTIFILKELSTLIFSVQMRKRIMEPLGKLKVGVDEISKGHYGYQVEEDNINMVGDLIDSFNKMSRELKEASDLKDKYETNRKELIAGISHDLKTPITSIIGYVDAIQTGVATTKEKQNTYLSIIEANAKYTDRLINDLFMFSKLDINQMKYEFVSLPIAEFLRDVVIEKQFELEEKGITVAYEIDISDQLMLPIDGKMVYRILSNILSNAVKYGDQEKPEIYIQASQETDGIKVMITDNGPGIPANELKQIFDVFYRGDSARNKEIGGTGLGLAITKQLVEAHGGSINAFSKMGSGTTIVFTLKNRVRKGEQVDG